MNRRRRLVITAGAALCAVFVLSLAFEWWLARRVEQRYRAWEATIERDADGIRTDYHPLSAGEGRRAILFVHGFASPPSVFSRFVEHFAEHGYACRAIRLPGFGETVERAAEVTREDWVETVRDAARALRAEREGVWMVTHSLGGAIALRALSDEPDLVDGVVLIAPLLRVSGERSPLLTPRQWFHIGSRMAVHTRMTESVFPLDADDESLNETFPRDLYIPLSIYVELFALLDEVAATRPPDGMPVLLAISTRDEIVDSSAAKDWYERYAMNGAGRALYVGNHGGHLMTLDTGWEEVLAFVDAFIRTNTASPALANDAEQR